MTNTELYAIARKHIGEGGAKARAYCGMSSGAWCNAYVCYIANEGGVKNLYFNGSKQTYCPTSIKWCNANLAMIPPYLAMPMDIIYFDWQPNGVPDHIGFVKAKISSKKIETHEGNTSGGKVDEKTRPSNYILGIYRPQFKPSESDKKTALTCDGDFGWQSIYGLQRALKLTADGILGKATVKALQKKAGCSADGAWGKGTSKAVQKMVGTTVDGAFGKNSVIALQKWINKQNTTTTTTTVTKGTHKMGHCASRKLDCIEQKFAYSSSSSSAYHWTYVAVWKDAKMAEKAAQFAEQCNKRKPIIQYDDKPNLKARLIKNGGKMPSGSLTANCSNYVNACVYYASHKNIYDYGAKNNLKYLKASGLFNIYTDSRVKKYVQRGAIYGGSHHTAISLGLK